MKKEQYEKPSICVIDIEAETIMAASDTGTKNEDYKDGGQINWDE